MTATFVGEIHGNLLTVASVSFGSLSVGQVITGSSVVTGTTIVGLGTGTGGAGNYVVSPGQVALSQLMSAGPGGAAPPAPPAPFVPPPLTPYAFAQPLNGATVMVGAGSVGLLMAPAGELSTLTVVLPPNPSDGWVFRLSTTNPIDALSVSSSDGSTVTNSSLTMGPSSAASWKYRLANTTWYPN